MIEVRPRFDIPGHNRNNVNYATNTVLIADTECRISQRKREERKIKTPLNKSYNNQANAQLKVS